MKKEKTRKTRKPEKMVLEASEGDFDPEAECDCHSDECCCEDESKMEMSKEEMDRMFTDAASDVWMKMFLQACEKEWQKQAGKNIQKMAAEYVKKSKVQWEQSKGK